MLQSVSSDTNISQTAFEYFDFRCNIQLVHILYSNRSAALIKMGQFTRALQDAVKAKELNRNWPKVRIKKLIERMLLSVWLLLIFAQTLSKLLHDSTRIHIKMLLH